MGYWVLQSNPLKFTILRSLAHQKEDYWPIEPEHRRRMRQKDIAFIWKSAGGEQGTMGIYGVGTIEQLQVSDNKIKEIDTICEGLGIHWIDKDSEKYLWQTRQPVLVAYMPEYKGLLNNPFLRSDIEKIPALKHLPILRYFQYTSWRLEEKDGLIIEKELRTRLEI